MALYEQMVLAREVDRWVAELAASGRVPRQRSAAGESAVAVGAAAGMRDCDWLFLGQREVAAALWRGASLLTYACHLLGRESRREPGTSGGGRDALSPPCFRPQRVVSVGALPGPRIAHAVGVAWTARMRKEDVAALVFVDEASVDRDDFHTGLNFAGVMRAPLVVLCHGGRDDGTLSASPRRIAERASAYGLQGACVNGSDILAVMTAVREARARASEGEGGTLIDAAACGDPIALMRRHLEERGRSSGEDEERLVTDVRADVDRAFADAARCPAASPAALFDHVYA
ncbi:MAG: thiamine pyrophosphate-dependent enzyme, partial [Polyangiaceae bacterium]